MLEYKIFYTKNQIPEVYMDRGSTFYFLSPRASRGNDKAGSPRPELLFPRRANNKRYVVPLQPPPPPRPGARHLPRRLRRRGTGLRCPGTLFWTSSSGWGHARSCWAPSSRASRGAASRLRNPLFGAASAWRTTSTSTGVGVAAVWRWHEARRLVAVDRAAGQCEAFKGDF